MLHTNRRRGALLGLAKTVGVLAALAALWALTSWKHEYHVRDACWPEWFYASGYESPYCSDVKDFSTFTGWGTWLSSLMEVLPFFFTGLLIILGLTYVVAGKKLRIRGSEASYYKEEEFITACKWVGGLALGSAAFLGVGTIVADFMH